MACKAKQVYQHCFKMSDLCTGMSNSHFICSSGRQRSSLLLQLGFQKLEWGQITASITCLAPIQRDFIYYVSGVSMSTFETKDFISGFVQFTPVFASSVVLVNTVVRIGLCRVLCACPGQQAFPSNSEFFSWRVKSL